MDEDLALSKECLHILNCFLDPKNMKKVEELLNPNAEVLEYTKDGKIKPKQPPSSNVPKRDPIWEFFSPRHAREGTLILLVAMEIILSF